MIFSLYSYNSRLPYYSYLHVHELFCCLQSAQNAAALLVTGANRSDHVLQLLRQFNNNNNTKFI